MLVIYGFYSEKKIGKNSIYKRLQFWTILFPCKKCVTEKRTLRFPLFRQVFCQYHLINYSPLCIANCDGNARLSEPIIGPPPRTCSSCNEDTITSEDQGVSGKCSHVYHEHCIVPWLDRGHNCCPRCKYDSGTKKTRLELSKSMRERFPLGREMEFSDRVCVIL
jgi:hypothetical protein